MFVVQIYLFIAIPCWLLGVRQDRLAARADNPERDDGRPERRGGDAGFLLNRIGWLLLGSGALGIVGGALVAIGAVLHVTASSSVRVVKLSLRLRPDDTCIASARLQRRGAVG